MLTKEQVEKYINSGGVNCPYCDSTEIEGSSFDMESGTVTQNIKCLTCNKEWTDIYKLHGIWEFEDLYGKNKII